MSQQTQLEQEISLEAFQLAERHHLSTPLSVYNKTSVTLVGLILITLFLIPFFIAPIIVTILIFNHNGSLYAPWPILALVGLFWYAIVIFLESVALFGYRNRKQQVHLYTEGFIYFTKHKAEVVRWDQIETIWRGKSDEGRVTRDSLHLRKIDGTKCTLDVPLRDRLEMCETIEREFVRIHLPGIIERYNAGNTLDFGFLSISLEGIAKYKDVLPLLPWNEVESIEVGPEYLKIRKIGRRFVWVNYPIPYLPNACLLRELVRYFRSNQQ